MAKAARTARTSILNEFAEVDLGDGRRAKRLNKIVERVDAAPSLTFPRMMDDNAELEGFYRFIRNEAVTYEQLLAPHKRATVERISSFKEVLVVHDTTEVSFRGEREGLGRLNQSGSGFHAHIALATAAHGERAPLGVLAVEPWARKGPTATALRKAKKVTAEEYRALPREQDRWWRSVSAVEEAAGQTTSIVHVMDSDADDFDLMCKMSNADLRWVIRLCYDRRTIDGEKTKEFVAEKRVVATRSVHLSRRRRQPGGDKRVRQRARDERDAELGISASQVEWNRPSYLVDSPRTLTVHIVRVWEIKPPIGADPIEWILITTEPIDTEEQILRVVDYYRERWVIEEYFHALKTGCALEKRQLESWDTLLKAMAIFLPIAWNLLRLRTLSRDPRTTKLSARTLLSPTELDVLARASKKPLPSSPTVGDATLAIARLGGHIANNGPPGWQVLGRGYQDLLMMVAGYKLALAEK